MPRVTIRVETEPFDPARCLTDLSGVHSDSGAVASFLGQVRGEPGLEALELEHYPGVTEQALRRIAETAIERWSLSEAVIVHRVGLMKTGEPIVFTGASAPHRRAALDAVAYLIDVLKTQAPFWKKEYMADGTRWVEARPDDQAAAQVWLRAQND